MLIITFSDQIICPYSAVFNFAQHSITEIIAYYIMLWLKIVLNITHKIVEFFTNVNLSTNYLYLCYIDFFQFKSFVRYHYYQTLIILWLTCWYDCMNFVEYIVQYVSSSFPLFSVCYDGWSALIYRLLLYTLL